MRKNKYTIKTYYNAESHLYIKKANKQSKPHLMEMITTYKTLAQTFEKYETITVAEPILFSEYEIGFKPVPGESLDILVKKKQLTLQEAFEISFDLIDLLPSYRGDSNYTFGAFDFILSNIFLENKDIYIIDYERTTEKYISKEYLKYRTVRDYYMRKYGTLQRCLHHTRKEGFSFIKMILYETKETNFQSSVNQSQSKIVTLIYVYLILIHSYIGIQ